MKDAETRGFQSRFQTCSSCVPTENRHSPIRFALSIVLSRYGLNELLLVGFHYQSINQDVPTYICLCLASFIDEHPRPSHLMLIAVQMILSSTANLTALVVCAMSKSALPLASVLRAPSQMHAAQICWTVIGHAPAHKTTFLFHILFSSICL